MLSIPSQLKNVSLSVPPQSLDRVTSQDIENMLESVALNLALSNGGESAASPDAKRRLLQGGVYFDISGRLQQESSPIVGQT